MSIALRSAAWAGISIKEWRIAPVAGGRGHKAILLCEINPANI
jgi:hypothetical protein